MLASSIRLPEDLSLHGSFYVRSYPLGYHRFSIICSSADRYAKGTQCPSMFAATSSKSGPSISLRFSLSWCLPSTTQQARIYVNHIRLQKWKAKRYFNLSRVYSSRLLRCSLGNPTILSFHIPILTTRCVPYLRLTHHSIITTRVSNK